MSGGPYAVSWVDRHNQRRIVRFNSEESAKMFVQVGSVNPNIRGMSYAYLPEDLTEAELIYGSPVAQFLAEDR